MRGKGMIWPVLVTAALLFTVGVNVVMLFAASSDRNGSVVEPEYYRKAVEWDRTMARRAESARLGWSSAATLGVAVANASGVRERELVVTLTDSSGVPVTGAELIVTLIHNSDAANPATAVLRGSALGRYDARIPAAASGRWEVRVEARRGVERFGSVLHVEAP